MYMLDLLIWIKFSIFYWSEIQNLKWPHHLVIFASIYSVHIPEPDLATWYIFKRWFFLKLSCGFGIFDILDDHQQLFCIFHQLRMWDAPDISKAPCWRVCHSNQSDEAPNISRQIIVNSILRLMWYLFCSYIVL